MRKKMAKKLGGYKARQKEAEEIRKKYGVSKDVAQHAVSLMEIKKLGITEALEISGRRNKILKKVVKSFKRKKIEKG